MCLFVKECGQFMAITSSIVYSDIKQEGVPSLLFHHGK